MWTQERVLLAATIVVLTILLVSQATRHAQYTVVTAVVLAFVIIVRVIIPGIRALQNRKKPGRR